MNMLVCIKCNKIKKINQIKLRDPEVCKQCVGGVRRPYLYKHLKKTYCEQCEFRALHKCQLDIDHIDGNRNNNDSTNLRTLCANCHRLKTELNGDSLKRKRKIVTK